MFRSIQQDMKPGVEKFTNFKRYFTIQPHLFLIGWTHKKNYRRTLKMENPGIIEELIKEAELKCRRNRTWQRCFAIALPTP